MNQGVKKFVLAILLVSMALMLCSCGKEKRAFEVSKAAYNNINSAYQTVEVMGGDIYTAWRLGIYEKDEMSIELLADELSLSEDDLEKGFSTLLVDIGMQDLLDMEVDLDTFFTLFEDEMFSVCVEIVKQAYTANGKIQFTQDCLREAKSQMKALGEDYSDYEHYPSLKGYYAVTNSFFDFCQNPTGSFEQMETTINDYRNEARNYINDLDYIFEDEIEAETTDA